MHPLVDGYVRSTNAHDAATFQALFFAEDAVVDDAGRIFRGHETIKAWSDSDIFEALVTLDVLDVTQNGSETILTTKVDGNFDRTGLPDPVIITHRIEIGDDRIVRLTCRLAGEIPSNA